VCNVSYYSTTNEYNLVQLNYNDGNIGTYNFTKKYFNFGPDIPFNITSPFELTDTSNDPTAYTAIMTNTELLNRSSVLGFEMFATSAGLIRINVIIIYKYIYI
jgi:phosphoribosylaminoimidazole carboxylase (NCAIR synthetase)